MPAVLTDEDLTLRPAIKGDGRAYLELGWSAEIHRMFGGSDTTPPKNPRKIAAWWIRSIRAQPYAWVIENDKQMIGQIRLHTFDQTDLSARLAVGILTDDQLGRGVGRRAIRLVLGYAFAEMDLNRVDLRVLDFNERAIRCYKAGGF